ncbi:MAG: Rossmann fold domain-containing protein [Pontixanthobacter sp.]
MDGDLCFIDDLSGDALTASAYFHDHAIARIAALFERGSDTIAIVVPVATYDHRDWRLAATRDLARRYAPRRINMIEGGRGPALEAASAYLRSAPGVTGQYLPLSQSGD